MAEDSDLERTEPASPRRLEQARERGQVARSPELSTFSVLLAAGGGLVLMGSALVEALGEMMRKGLTLDRAAAFDPALMLSFLYQESFAALAAFWPVLLLMAAAAVAAPLLMGGWTLSFQALQPDFNRLNPAAGISRIFSWHGAVGLVKAVAKTVLIGGVAAWAVWHEKDAMLSLGVQPLQQGIHHLGGILGFTFLSVAGALALIVAIDVPFQLWEYGRKLRMTKEEVRQEAKETEGDPQLKARIRALQREAARKRMMAEVPKADVIITNPTHYAVALRYQEKTMRAPQVVAKGSRLLAQRICELGRENRVPIVSAPPLARALYAHAELGREIPAPLFTAVAEVLAYVYQLRASRAGGGAVPVPPAALPVPAELDPESRAA